ncbi:hypothetical protein Q8F55_003416 [Vanrija albida]|uniref:NnrU domain-containing protein n=1 Tax=Vanrija albida TaxID=181172 RepID=A0ABR3Q3W2_9TREE
MTAPLGALVRLRVNHRPVSVRLAEETGTADADAEATRTPTTLWGMLAASKRQYGWDGVFAGWLWMLLTALAAFFTSRGALHALEKINYPRGMDAQSTAAMVLTSLLIIPLCVVTTREMVTPFNEWSAYQRSLHIQPLHKLLTAEERANPLRLYSWGLVAAVALRSSIYFVVLPRIKHALLGVIPILWVDMPHWYAFWGSAFLFTTCLTPLDVLVARLAAQRSDELGTYSNSDGGMRLIEIRSPPYAGLVDAVSCILQEEGWTAFFRGWVWTGLFAMAVSTVLML